MAEEQRLARVPLNDRNAHDEAAVVSEAQEDTDESDIEVANEDHDHARSAASASDDLFLCERMDEEDEAWVDRHLCGGRGSVSESGVGEGVVGARRRDDVRRRSTPSGRPPPSKQARRTNDDDDDDDVAERVSRLALRSDTDAILNCPYCFNVVCLDCQRHKSLRNQYRAMFVTNVRVRWEEKLVFDEDFELVPKRAARDEHEMEEEEDDDDEGEQQQRRGGQRRQRRQRPQRIPVDDDDEEKVTPESEKIHYSVCCDNCGTDVAILDIEEEVYHFVGCIASS